MYYWLSIYWIAGSAGSAIEARTNYFVIKAEGTTVYQYSVSFEPDGLSEDLRQLIITQNPGLLGPTLLLDGHMLYLPIKLPDPVRARAVCDFNYCKYLPFSLQDFV